VSLTMVHSNPASTRDGIFRVDRKFHSGMLQYVDSIDAPITTIHPMVAEGAAIMDPIELPVDQLPYRVLTLRTDPKNAPMADQIPQLRQLIAGSKLVYGGAFGAARMASEAGVACILALEYDLPTEISVAVSRTQSPLRRAVRMARIAMFYASSVRDMRRAHSLHCNGYPIYDATRRHCPDRLLYLDSRMSADMLATEERLAQRFASRASRPLRLLYSGRYERIKGATDVVEVAVECLRRGMDIELHTYGQGQLKAEMEHIAAGAPTPGRVHIHDAIPYPELVERSRDFDLFVCCHVQNDPSCTYLESLGSGLPIVGYANRMWQRLCDESGAGRHSPMGRPAGVADDIQALAANHGQLESLSRRALEFARQHTFEIEFRKRTDAINAALAKLGAR